MRFDILSAENPYEIPSLFFPKDFFSLTKYYMSQITVRLLHKAKFGVHR